jgi:predicted ATPase
MDEPYFADVRRLASCMRVVHDVKSTKGFYFSGEDFIAYLNRLNELKQGLSDDLQQMEREFAGKSEYVKNLALGPIRGQLHALETTYGGDLQERSHGEGFLQFFRVRMHTRGLYLLDEPEIPLSAVNQYQLMVMLTDLARDGSQIILATHSPILMALEDARILQFTDDGIHPIRYEDIETVQFTKAFLNDPDNYTRRI